VTTPLAHALEVLVVLVWREVKIRYKGSFLGLLWALLSPLGTVAILHFLFTRVLPLDIPHYAAFVYAGLLPFTWFQASVQTGASTLLDNRDLVRKPFFPRVVLPAVVTGTNFVLYLVAIPVLAFLVAAEKLPLTPALVGLPAVWAVQGLLTLAFATLFASLGVLVRDVQHVLGVAMTLWFYLTPVFYDLGRVSPEYARWLSWNPMTPIVQAHRAIFLEGRAPEWASLAPSALLAAAMLAAGLALFRGLEGTLVEDV
jgi:lipopolysaccharide transport system permease protein